MASVVTSGDSGSALFPCKQSSTVAPEKVCPAPEVTGVLRRLLERNEDQAWGAMAEGTKTVLIADDEPTVANTLRMILESAGYRTIVAHDGQEAARLIREAGPDAVLLDVILPRMDGVEVAIEACRTAPNCKVVLFSGRPDAADLLAAARARGYSFEILPKPTRPQELLEKLRDVLVR